MSGNRTRDLLVIVLTVTSGAVDAISFLGLGGVFTAVMTGNLVLLGLAVGSGALAAAARSAGAVPAYAAGVFLAGLITGPGGGGSRAPAPWPARVTVALGVELCVEIGWLVGWVATDGRPEGGAALVLIAVSAVAMGIQAGAVRTLSLPALSTTYLTGTLTWLVGLLATGTREPWAWRLQAAAIGGLVVGAASGASMLRAAPRWAGVLPATLVAAVVVTATAAGRPRRPVCCS
ncbi:MAG: hypothetical protein QOG45_2775 [Chloroflexota bacterium]|jgi:uncharacterized membrane protein YoaK (UPF0700 family)|nr:hypothetical protein [Chloroflexota bacterium]